MKLKYIEIRASLDRLHDQHQLSIESDPIWFPLQYKLKKDREVVAFLAAHFAFGNVKMIFKTLHNLKTYLGNSPYDRILSASDKDRFQHAFSTHRWIKPGDTRSFLHLLQHVLLTHGSLEKSFIQVYDPSDSTLEASMIRWMRYLQQTLIELQQSPLTRGQKFFLSSPSGGSTSKRLLMFFRWMVRKESPDLGLWKGVSASQLLMPLDAHLQRFSQYLGFTQRKQHGWKAVVQSTHHFRQICPEDPVKYDFSLARLGILNLCMHKVDPLHCNPCPIRKHCGLYRGKHENTARIFT